MLKNILRLLLSKFYSKQESELVGHQAMPSSSSVAVQASPASVTDWTQVASYTAPTDGYISVRGLAQANGSVIQLIAGLNTQNPSISTTATSGGQWPQTVMPVAKGRNIAIYCGQTSNITVFFNKTIGGGCQTLKKLILQGGGLCLKVWYSSLRRSSCRVKDRGFNTQLVRPRMQRPSALQPTANGINLHPAGTVLSHTLETPQALFWKSPVAAQVSLILNRLQDGILFRYRKVKNLGTSFQQIQQCPICTLSLCEVQTNFAVGGPSC